MGIVVRFPNPGHASAPAFVAAANSAKRAAVTPASRAKGRRMIACHHSEGMRSRCDHFRTAVAGAPISSAKATCEGQSEITSRNEAGVVMPEALGRFVLTGKAILSQDCEFGMEQNGLMAKKQTVSRFSDDFQARTREAREAAGYSQTRLAKLLGIEQGTYKQYESRAGSMLPHDLLPLFCELCRVSLAWMYLGEESESAATPARPAAKSASPGARRKVA